MGEFGLGEEVKAPSALTGVLHGEDVVLGGANRDPKEFRGQDTELPRSILSPKLGIAAKRMQPLTRAIRGGPGIPRRLTARLMIPRLEMKKDTSLADLKPLLASFQHLA